MPTRRYNDGVVIDHEIEEAVIIRPASPAPDITKRLDRFNIDTKTWDTLRDMEYPRAGFALHHSYDLLYAIGGTDGSSLLKSVEEYDISSDEWVEMTTMPIARCYFPSIEIDGYIYCIGGVTSNTFGDLSLTRQVDRYDTLTNSWTTLAPLNEGHAVAMSVAHHINGKIYIMSGYLNEIGTLNTKVIIYDIDSDSWSESPDVEGEELALYRRLLPFSFVKDDKIYCVSGVFYTKDSKIFMYDSYVYDPTIGDIARSDSMFSDMPKPRFAGCSASIYGKNYFLGGVDEKSNTLRWFEEVNSSAEPFDYEQFSKLKRGRSSFGCTPYDGEYGTFLYTSGGVISNQGEDFLRVEVETIPSTIKLNGKQTGAVNVVVYDENGESPADIVVRLTATPGPVLWTADDIHVINGYGMATLLPRAEDANGPIAMNDGDIRGYSVTISGSLVDPRFFGETEPVAAGTTTDFQVINPNAPPALGRPPVKIVGEYTSVVTVDQTTQGSYLKLASIGGFLELRPRPFGGGRSSSVTWFGDQSWLPVVNQIINDNLGSFELINDYLDRMSREDVFGGSPMLDGLMRTLDILEFDETGIKKMIYLQSDGEENSSNATVTDVVNRVKQISGNKLIPIVSSIYRVVPSILHLDQGIRGGSTSADALADATNGSTLYVFTDNDIDRSIRSLLTARGFVGSGLFDCTIDLGEEVRIESITASFDVSDPDAKAYWRYSIGNEDKKYSILSDRIEPNETITIFETEGRYIKFAAEFAAELSLDTYGFGNLTPPRLNSIEIIYHKQTTSYLYFNPQKTGDQVHQIVITLDAQQRRGNEINVATSSEETHDWNNLVSDAQPSLNNSTRIVIPIRLSLEREQFTLEALVTVDGFIFEAKYGKWAADAEVNVYNDSGDLISPLAYRTFPYKGFVVFDRKRNNKYVIEIKNKPNITAAAKITNRVVGEPVVVMGSGYFYTTIKKKKFTRSSSNILPEAINLLLSPILPSKDSYFIANYTFYDLKGRVNKGTEIKWYINDAEDIDLRDLKEWDNRDRNLVKKGDVIYFSILPKSEDDIGRIVRSIPVRIG